MLFFQCVAQRNQCEAEEEDRSVCGTQLSTGAIFAGADLNRTTITGSSFRNTTSGGLTKEQFYTTNNYVQNGLSGMVLADNDLSKWDFSDRRGVEGC